MMERFNAWATMLVGRIEGLKKEDGQTFVEYALILAVVVVALLLVYTQSSLGTSINTALTNVSNAITGA
jgi:Flp pilus assembly pilin Flp